MRAVWCFTAAVAASWVGVPLSAQAAGRPSALARMTVTLVKCTSPDLLKEQGMVVIDLPDDPDGRPRLGLRYRGAGAASTLTRDPAPDRRACEVVGQGRVVAERVRARVPTGSCVSEAHAIVHDLWLIALGSPVAPSPELLVALGPDSEELGAVLAVSDGHALVNPREPGHGRVDRALERQATADHVADIDALVVGTLSEDDETTFVGGSLPEAAEPARGGRPEPGRRIRYATLAAFRPAQATACPGGGGR